MPILKPRQQLLGIASIALLADNLPNVRRFVLVDPQQRLRRRVGENQDLRTQRTLRRLTVLGLRCCCCIAAA